MIKVKSYIIGIILFVFIALTVNVFAWEKNVTVVSSGTYKYKNVATRIEQETGHVYIVYKRRDSAKQISDIYLRKYDGKKVTAVGDNDGNVSQSPSMESYFPHVQIKKGIVHVAWTEHPKGNDHAHTIKYRSFDGEQWSKIWNLGGNITGGEVEDLRMDVDENGNVFVVFMDWGPTKCRLSFKIGDVIKTVNFPLEGRAKHPDIGIAGDTLYVDWQWRAGNGEYSLGTAHRKTTVNGDWLSPKAVVKSQNVARPRIAVSKEGVRTYFYHDELGSGQREPWVFVWKTTNNTTGVKKILGTDVYHFSNIATRGGSTFYAAQLGPSSGGYAIRYNWQNKKGVWTGLKNIPNVTSPKGISLDLSADGEAAVVVYETPSSIKLIRSGEIKGDGSFEAIFTVNPESVFFDNAISFDASGTELPDSAGSVRSYKWDFGDGNTETTIDANVSHTYQVFRKDVEIKLNIEMDDGTIGVGSKTIYINAPYSAILDGNPKKIEVKTLIYNRLGYEIKWSENVANENAGYQVKKYEVWRALKTGINPPNSEEEYSWVADVNSDVFKYVDYSDGIKDDSVYYYKIRTVDSNDHKSPLFEENKTSNLKISQSDNKFKEGLRNNK